MTETALKFGPEWLRALSQGGTEEPPSNSGVRYRLAEHRYGREEMLALFDRSVRPPDPLKTFSSLFIEKTQLPLALTQMTEEETRMWQRGVNSDAVLRLMGRGGPPAGTAPRGRGGSVDRGRGRGRGGYYTRGLSFEDEAPPNTSYSRGGRAFERSQSTGVERDRERERGWGERNGVEEWNGATSPRKGFESRAPYESWRTRAGGRTATSWREDRDPENERGGRERAPWDGNSDYRGSGSGRWDEHSTHHPTRRSWDEPDSLPEWATEKPGDSSGSFDASGAFHGAGYSDEETDGDPHVREHHNKKEINNQQNPDRGIRPRLSHTLGSNSKKIEEEALDPSGASSSEGGSPPRSMASSVSSSRDGTNGQSNGGIASEGNSVPGRTSAPSSMMESSAARSIDVLTSESRSSPVQTSPQHNSAKVLRQAVPTTTSEMASSNVDSVNGATTSVLHSHPSIPSSNSILSSVPLAVAPGLLADKNGPFVHPQMSSMQALQNRTLVSPQLLPTFVSQPNPSTLLQSSLVAGPAHLPPRGLSAVPQQTEDDLDSMKAAADDLVAKLMEDDDPRHILSHMTHQATPSPPPGGHSIHGSDKWFYRDPQGEVQGPFTPAEMNDWYRSGYFTNSLLVRRGCDERFSELGQLIVIWGQVPFGSALPPVKSSEEPTTIPNPVMTTQSIPHTMNTPIPSASEQDNFAALQHYQKHLLQQQLMQQQQQQLLLRQATVQAVVTKLAQTEPRWNSLSPLEQQQLVRQHLMPLGAAPPGPVLQHMNMQTEMVQQKNPLQALFSQLHQPKVPPVPATESLLSSSLQTQKLDPVQHLIQQIALNATPRPPPPELTAQPKTDTADPIQALLQQIAARNGPQPPVDSLWGATTTASFTVPAGWIPPSSVAPPTSVPPSSLPSSVWDLAQTSESVAAQEKQRLEEEERRKEEERRRHEEEEQERQRLEREEQERKMKEEKRQQEELKRLEDEKRKQEEKRRKEEEKKKQQEEKKRQEELKRRIEEEKRARLEEEKRKQEEKRQKEEEERKRREEEKRQQEEDERRLKLEEEMRRQKEEEERLQKEEEEERRKAVEKRQQEALRRLQEQQRAKAWNQAAQQTVTNSTLSLAEIQQLQEKEKKEKQIQHQQQQQQQLQQLQMMAQQRELSSTVAGPKGSMNLKWAEKAAPAVAAVKSLAEIQAEEEERMAEQLEKEKVEKSFQQNNLTLSAAGVWGTASQNLNWTARSASGQAQSAWSTSNNNANSTGGFWDEVTPAPPAPQSKQQGQSKSGKSGGGKGSGSGSTSNSSSSSKSNKNRSKKDEETVMKIFEQTVQRTDEFTQWCNRTLSGLQVSVDIPTFVGFLKDVESPYDVTDYVKSYLGDGKDVREFARQFLERRSKWRNSQKAAPEYDDLCTPAPAVNPLSADFCEVKGKPKKPKKGKMLKIDARILGFSVTAATDRINIGERDYGEGV